MFSSLEKFNYKNIFLVLFIFTFFKIHALFEGIQSQIVFFVFCGALAFYLIILNFNSLIKINNIDKKYFFLIILYFLIEFIALVRGLSLGSISFLFFLQNFLWQLLIFLCGIHLVSNMKSILDIKMVLIFIFIGIYIYLFLNIVLVFFGFTGESLYGYFKSSVIGRGLGIQLEVVYFPLVTGFKSIANITMFVFIAAIAFYKYDTYFFRKKIVLLIVSIISIYILFVVDSRATFTAALITLPFLFVNKRNLYLIVQSGWLLFPLLSILFLTFSQLANNFDFLTNNFSRGATGDFQSLSGRADIWEAILVKYNEAPIEIIYGYGANAQVYLNLLSEYDYLFAGMLGDTSKSVHSAAYQIFIDKGLIGIIIFMMIMFKMIKQFNKLDKVGPALLLPFLSLLIITSTNVVINVIDFKTLFLLLVIISSSNLLTQNNKIL